MIKLNKDNYQQHKEEILNYLGSSEYFSMSNIDYDFAKAEKSINEMLNFLGRVAQSSRPKERSRVRVGVHENVSYNFNVVN